MKPDRLVVSRTPDQATVSLAESLPITLTLEGPAPLRIEPPANWLSDSSADVWKISHIEPAKLEALPDGRERWSLSFRVDPFVPGNVPLQFATAMANGEVIDWPGLEVRVISTLDAKTAEVRPITGIETVPPSPPLDVREDSTFAIIAFAILAITGLMLVIARRMRRRVPESPFAWAVRELDQLERTSPAMEANRVLDRLSHVVRVYLERVTQIPATRLTTAEVERQGEPAFAAWRNLLERCDAVKFAGEPTSHEECSRLLAEARERIREAWRIASPTGRLV